jgi:hypothetical protein
MKSSDKIYLSDIRKVAMCSKGSRKFFERHSLSWGDFIKHGVDIEIIKNTNDAMAEKVVKFVESGRR